jgi:hypothetical protein
LEEGRALTGIRNTSRIVKALLSPGNVKVVGLKVRREGCLPKSAKEEYFVPAVSVGGR